MNRTITIDLDYFEHLRKCEKTVEAHDINQLRVSNAELRLANLELREQNQKMIAQLAADMVGSKNAVSDDSSPSSFADAIARSGKKQCQIASEVGITDAYLSEIKTGLKRALTPEKVFSLAKALGISEQLVLTFLAKNQTGKRGAA